MTDTTSTGTVFLEKKTSFSQSKLWEYQEAYFAEKGIAAWLGPVPYYVTSNAVIGHSYAHVVCRYIQDGLRSGFVNIDHPIYLLEIGTGSGRFSYHFLQTLETLFNKLQIKDVKIRYIMSDFTEKNLEYWQHHHQLKKFVDRGWLDFAVHHVSEQQPIQLTLSQETLTKDMMHNPMVLIANYVFDTVNHDVFRVEKGELYEGLISVSTPSDNLDGDQVIELKHLKTEFDFSPITTDHYDNPALNEVLSYYKENLNTSTFLIPLGGLACVDQLRELTDDRLLVVTGDKSYTSEASLNHLRTPHIAFHGSFSMMVNYHAVEKYVEALGGDSLMGSDTEGFKISLFSLGQKLADCPETTVAFDESIQRFTTKEFLPLKNHILKHVDQMETADLLALLKISRWDPDVVYSVTKQLSGFLPKCSEAFQKECREGLLETFHQYYFMPNNKNIYFTLGHLHHLMSDVDTAIERYEDSLRYFPADAPTYANLALCYYQNDRVEEAKTYTDKALEHNPELGLAKNLKLVLEEKS